MLKIKMNTRDDLRKTLIYKNPETVTLNFALILFIYNWLGSVPGHIMTSRLQSVRNEKNDDFRLKCLVLEEIIAFDSWSVESV